MRKGTPAVWPGFLADFALLLLVVAAFAALVLLAALAGLLVLLARLLLLAALLPALLAGLLVLLTALVRILILAHDVSSVALPDCNRGRGPPFHAPRAASAFIYFRPVSRRGPARSAAAHRTVKKADEAGDRNAGLVIFYPVRDRSPISLAKGGCGEQRWQENCGMRLSTFAPW